MNWEPRDHVHRHEPDHWTGADTFVFLTLIVCCFVLWLILR